MSSSNEIRWEFEASDNGTYWVTLVVTDTGGHTDDATARFDIGPPFTYSNSPPVAVAAASMDGWNILLDGTNSTDVDGDALNYTWTIDGVQLDGARVKFHPSGDGSHEAQLEVRDPYGLHAVASTTVDFVLDRSVSLQPKFVGINTTTTFHLVQFRENLNGNFSWVIPELNAKGNGSNLTVDFESAGTYTVIVRNLGEVLLNQTVLAVAPLQAPPATEAQRSTPAPSAPPSQNSPGLTFVAALAALAVLMVRRRSR